MEKTENFLNNQKYIFGESEQKKVVSVFMTQRIIEYTKISLIIFIIFLAFGSQDFQSFVSLVILLICIWVMIKGIQFIIQTFKLKKIVWFFLVTPVYIISYLISYFTKYQTYKLKPHGNMLGNFEKIRDSYKSWTNGSYEIIKR